VEVEDKGGGIGEEGGGMKEGGFLHPRC
jgi:hypothetical protein